MNFQMIAFIIGRILLVEAEALVEAAALLVPMLTALICGEPLIPYLVTIMLLRSQLIIMLHRRHG